MPMTMTTTTTGTMADSMIDLDLQQLGVSSAAAIDVERNVIHDVCLLLGHVSSLSLTWRWCDPTPVVRCIAP